MATADVTLTSGMRNNLLQLQATSKLINRTQERLATGKKVNSALDNPTNFFAAQAALNRSSDLAIRKDGMAEGIQTAKAADAGITAISALIEAAKGVGAAALGTTSTTDRKVFGSQFNTLLSQVNYLASDSGYKGTNLLNGDTLTVNFNEDGSSKLKVIGFSAIASAAATGLGISSATSAWSDATVTASNTTINADMAKLATATSTLRTQSKTLAGNLNIITTRQDFTNAMISTLQTGADNLTLADMNEEGANMLMLQTRQSLGTTALSLSSQAAQAVLRLF